MSGDAGPDAEVCGFCKFVLTGRERNVRYYYSTVAAFADKYPSADGHTLIIPTRHVGRMSDLTKPEWDALSGALRTELLLAGATADAYTIGINDGVAAGQTVPHVHLHIIPRRRGDVDDPRGGIRWVLPETAPYWSAR